MQPARFHRSHGSHLDFTFFRDFKRKARQKVHPAFRFEFKPAKMRKARHNPRIVRHENIEPRRRFFQHHLAHLFRTFMQRPKCIVLARFKPLANSLVKTFSQSLLICGHITNKEISQTIERHHVHTVYSRRTRVAISRPQIHITRQLPPLGNALRSLDAAPHRTREINRIANRRDYTPQRNSLTPPAFRKPHMRTKVLVFWRNVVALSMAQKQINSGIPVYLCKKIRNGKKISSHL